MKKKCKNCKKIIRDATKPCPFCKAPGAEDEQIVKAVSINRKYLAVFSWLTFINGAVFFLVNYLTEGFSTNTVISAGVLLTGLSGILFRKKIFK